MPRLSLDPVYLLAQIVHALLEACQKPVKQ
jgi:hypothetical protein